MTGAARLCGDHCQQLRLAGGCGGAGCRPGVDRQIGPLHGVPVLVKDNYDVAGLQTTGGSAALLGWVPEADATVIAKIRAAGDIILPKTTMSEWARGGTGQHQFRAPRICAQSLQYRLCDRGILGRHRIGACRELRCRGAWLRHLWLDPEPRLQQCNCWFAHKLGIGFPVRHGRTLRQARHRRSDGPYCHRARAAARRHRRRRPGDRRGGWQDPADLHGISEAGRCRGTADRRPSSGVPPQCFRPAGPCPIRPSCRRFAACRGRDH